MTECPICNKGRLNEYDYEYVCDECGATFLLEYAGMYEEDAQEMTHDGFEPKEFLINIKIKYKNGRGLNNGC